MLVFCGDSLESNIVSICVFVKDYIYLVRLDISNQCCLHCIVEVTEQLDPRVADDSETITITTASWCALTALHQTSALNA